VAQARRPSGLTRPALAASPWIVHDAVVPSGATKPLTVRQIRFRAAVIWIYGITALTAGFLLLVLGARWVVWLPLNTLFLLGWIAFERLLGVEIGRPAPDDSAHDAL
jgi:hypothetical protein